MSNEKIDIDLCDKSGKKLYIGDKVRFFVEPFDLVFEGVIVLYQGCIYVEYGEHLISSKFSAARLHPLFITDEEQQGIGRIIHVHYSYEKIVN